MVENIRAPNIVIAQVPRTATPVAAPEETPVPEETVVPRSGQAGKYNDYSYHNLEKALARPRPVTVDWNRTDPSTGEKIKKIKVFGTTEFDERAKMPITSPNPTLENDAILYTKKTIGDFARELSGWHVCNRVVRLASMLGTRGGRQDFIDASHYLGLIEFLMVPDSGFIPAAIPDLKYREEHDFGSNGRALEECPYIERARGQIAEHQSEIDKLKVPYGEAKIGLGELIFTQVNENVQVTIGSNYDREIEKAIKLVHEGREKYCLDPRVSDEERPYFDIGKSRILEYQMRTLRNHPEDSEDNLNRELLDPIINWDLNQISGYISGNDYVCGDKGVGGRVWASRNLKKAMEGVKYVQAWAYGQKGKRVLQDAKKPHSEEEEKAVLKRIYSNDPNKPVGALQNIANAKKILEDIDERGNYLYHDLILAENDLLARKARVEGNETDKAKVAARYHELAENTPFNDIKSMAICGDLSLQIELSRIDENKASDYLRRYFDPSAGDKNLKSPFSENSYSYLALEKLECQLRNQVPQEVVRINRSDYKNYELVEKRSQHVKDAVRTLKVSDELARTDMSARASFEHAQARISSTANIKDLDTRKNVLGGARRELLQILRDTGDGGLINNVLNENRTETKDRKDLVERRMGGLNMDIDFYCGIWDALSNVDVQLGWVELEKMRTPNVSKTVFDGIFKGARDRLEELLAFSAKSKSPYFSKCVPKLVDLNKATIDAAAAGADAIAKSSAEISRKLDALAVLEKKASDFADELSDRNMLATVYMGLSGIYIGKLKLRAASLLCDTIARKIFYINNQRDKFLGDAGIGNKREKIIKLYDEIYSLKRKSFDDQALGPLLLPENGDDSKLENYFYALRTLLGVNSVYSAVNEKVAVDRIKLYYKNFIKRGRGGRDEAGIEVEYMDPLVNAVVVKGNMVRRGEQEQRDDADMKRDVMAEVRRLTNDRDKVKKAKAYVWWAHLNNWLYPDDNEKLKEARRYYVNALDIYNSLNNREKVELYTDAPSILLLRNDKYLVDFVLEKRGPGATINKIGRYLKIKDDLFKDIFNCETDTSALENRAVSDKVSADDEKAKIKAGQTLTFIALSLSDPDIAAIEDAAKTRKSITEQVALAGKLPAAAPAHAAAAAMPRKEYLKSLLAKLEQAMKDIPEGTKALFTELAGYKESIEGFLNEALTEGGSGGDFQTQAEFVLRKAQYTGWTAGGSVERYLEAERLYKLALKLNPNVFATDVKAEYDYAEVLAILTYLGENRYDLAVEHLKNVIARDIGREKGAGISAGKAYIHLSNLKSMRAAKDLVKLKDAQEDLNKAIKKFDGVYRKLRHLPARTQSASYVDMVSGMHLPQAPLTLDIADEDLKAVVERSLEALCRQGVLEGRRYSAKDPAVTFDLAKEHIDRIMGVVRPFRWYDLLVEPVNELERSYDLVMFLKKEDLEGQEKDQFKNQAKFKESNNRKLDIGPKVGYLLKKVGSRARVTETEESAADRVDDAEESYIHGDAGGFLRGLREAYYSGLLPGSVPAQRLEKYKDDMGLYLPPFSINYNHICQSERVVSQVPLVEGKDVSEPVAPWEAFMEDGQGNIVFGNGPEKSYRSEVNSFGIRTNIREFPGGALGLGFDFSTTNYLGSNTERGTILPWIDKTTPDWVIRSNNWKFDLLQTDLIRTYQASIKYALSVYGLIPHAKVLHDIINKVNIGASVARTEAQLTVNTPVYDAWTDGFKLTPSTSDISRTQVDIPYSIETVTQPIAFKFPWQVLGRLEFGGGHSEITASSIPDKYYVLEENGKMPESSQGRPFGDRKVIDPGGGLDKYYDFDDRNGNGVNEPWNGDTLKRDTAKAQKVWDDAKAAYLNARMNQKKPSNDFLFARVNAQIPFLGELLNVCGLMNSDYEEGSDPKLSATFTYKAEKNGMDAAKNFMPYGRNLWTNFGMSIEGDTNGNGVQDPGETLVYDDLNRNGKQDPGEEYHYEYGFLNQPLVKELQPTEIITQELTLSYMPKFSDLGKIKGLGILFGWVGKGWYLPLQATFGQQDFKDPNVSGETHHGWYRSFGAGLKYRVDDRNDVQIMYYYEPSNNGFNYNSESHRIAAIWNF